VALATDVERLNGRTPVGAADDAWLALGHTLFAAADLPVGQRAAVLCAGASQVEVLVLPGAAQAVRTVLSGAAVALRALAARLAIHGTRSKREPGEDAQRAATRAAIEAVQAVVAQEEQAGAFVLAFSTLAALRRALSPVLDRRAEGLVLAQQGRVARQLGALSAAAELYAGSVRAARAARAPDVTARALIGSGVLASMRGNYPEARAHFRHGLEAATRAGSDEHRRAAHHGLLVAALAARDVETALAHGWAAFRDTPVDAVDERAEMLLNLGAVARQAGEYRASLGACLRAVEFTDAPRLRLPALGSAAIAAAQLRQTRLLTFLIREVERSIPISGQPFENARALTDLAEAWVALDVGAAIAFADRAEAIAQPCAFHEVAARVEVIRAEVATVVRAPTKSMHVCTAWSAGSRTIFTALEAMCASGQSQWAVQSFAE
jgi:tetratricopeptide (TPR) repeat protein